MWISQFSLEIQGKLVMDNHVKKARETSKLYTCSTIHTQNPKGYTIYPQKD